MSLEQTPNAQEFTGQSLPERLRCRYTNNRGIRCQHRLFDNFSGLCLLHQRYMQEEAEEQAQELTTQLFAELTAIDDRIEVRSFLFRLMRLISEKQIDRRDGQMLVYSCNLLLQTFPVRKAEPEEERDVEIVWDLLGPEENHDQDADESAEDSSGSAGADDSGDASND